MHIHILGICGTFMGGLAILARQLGYKVSGSDTDVYPPMSTQLQEQGIALMKGYDAAHLDPEPDLVVIGNALSRGNAAIEHVLNSGLPYVSGPQFLADHVLRGRWVLAVAGTHGKTTTTSMLTYILEYAGLKPGFLVGGVPMDFGLSARLGEKPFFVVEADEYDTAFFDKRSKFVHYRPRTAILNNLEFDHADIFPDLDAIKRQFHHFVRTIPGNGLIIAPGADKNIADVIKQGCWTPVEYLNDNADGWQARDVATDGSSFNVYFQGAPLGRVEWQQLGQHSVHNGLAAIAAARHAGVPVQHAVAALSEFKGVKRRLELRATVNNIAVYDDFAHHPTAIATTLDGLRKRVGHARIIAVVEARSNTMRMGVHIHELPAAFAQADEVVLYNSPGLGWDVSGVAKAIGPHAQVQNSVDAIVASLAPHAQSGDHILIMSNGAFGGLHERLIEALRNK